MAPQASLLLSHLSNIWQGSVPAGNYFPNSLSSLRVDPGGGSAEQLRDLLLAQQGGWRLVSTVLAGPAVAMPPINAQS